MRKALMFFTTLIILFTLSSKVFADSKMIEMPEVKFLINSRPAALTDVPLEMSGRMLLPLRAALVSLGVPNDNEHIKWNGNNRSVTIIKDKTKIFLKVDSKTAYINDAAVELDVPPMLYVKNQRVYIPVRFVAEAAGMAVAWDPASKTVYIRDKDKFNNAMVILEKVDSTMNSIIRARVNTVMKLDISGKASKASFNVNINEELDRNARVLYSKTQMQLLNGSLDFISYYTGNTEYFRSSTVNKWDVTALKKNDFDMLLKEDISLSSINNINIMSACMEEETGANPGERVLKGDVFPKSLAANIAKNIGISNLEADRYYLEALIDADTNLVKKLYVELDGKYSKNGEYSQIKALTTVTYSDIDGSFTIGVPKGIIASKK